MILPYKTGFYKSAWPARLTHHWNGRRAKFSFTTWFVASFEQNKSAPNDFPALAERSPELKHLFSKVWWIPLPILQRRLIHPSTSQTFSHGRLPFMYCANANTSFCLAPFTGIQNIDRSPATHSSTFSLLPPSMRTKLFLTFRLGPKPFVANTLWSFRGYNYGFRMEHPSST